MFNFSKLFTKPTEETAQAQDIRDILKAKYKTFQILLSTNNQVLETMADMEEKRSGDYLFDLQYLNEQTAQISAGVQNIIESLNALSGDKYMKLYQIFSTISHEIASSLTHRIEIPISDLTIPLDQITGDMAGIAGGKIAHLGEVRNRLDLPTPAGFTISSYAFVKFMEHNNLSEKINKKLSLLSVKNMDEVNQVSKEIHDMIVKSDIPEELEKAIHHAYAELCNKVGRETTVSVRSSALNEDRQFSFAGQYATFLNVPGGQIPHKYKQVVASLFTPRAIFYYKTKGFSEEEMVMAVGVLRMIDSVAGGVVYTRDPNNPDSDSLIINAIRGLGILLEDGNVTPDSYVVSRHPVGMIQYRRYSKQQIMLVNNPSGTIEEVMIPSEKRGELCLDDDQIKVLAEYSLDLEKHYGTPQDIEWTIDREGRIYILQSRPLRSIVSQGASRVCIPTRFEGYQIILDKGAIACKGAGCGKAYILENEDDLKNFPEGAVLIAKHTSPKFVTVMDKAGAIITDVGSVTGHMASLSREYQVPTILDTEIATETIENNKLITVDAINCRVYEGKVDELLEYAAKKQEIFKETRLFKTMGKVLDLIAPLNLVDPESEDFLQDSCKTFHDITRFAHETAMHEMFNIGEGQDVEGIGTVVLAAGIPMDAHLLDIDGGIAEKIKKATPKDILSIPFAAFLNGLKNMKWPEPKNIDVKGFLGMMAHTASIPEEELLQMGKTSFCILSENYMNFSIRLGYHFSMVEAYAGENIHDNYIKFFFKGGGATQDRRLRRVRLITEILREMGFRINVKEDVINAIFPKYKESVITGRLEILGKLTVFTKQLDMVLFNDAITDIYIEQFVRDYVHPSV